MDERLAGIDERLRRAHEHLTFLDKEIPAWRDRVDRTIFGEFDREASEYVFYIKSGPPPPGWGILVSEFTHHIRAALEEIVWQLVLLRGDNPQEGKPRKPGTGFPILDHKRAWKAGENKAKVRGLRKNDLTIIKAAQPYHRARNLPTDMDKASLKSFREFALSGHPLLILRRLNNVDKHSVLQPALFGSAGMAQPVGKDGTFGPTGIKDTGPWGLEDVFFLRGLASDNRTEVMRVRLREPGPDPQMEMKNDVSLEITFGHAPPGNVWGFIRDCYGFAKNEVIEPLSRAFDA